MTREEIARRADPVALATWELEAVGAPMADLGGTQHNVAVAQGLGQLILDIDQAGERVTGFVAYLRLAPEQLLAVARQGTRLFTAGDNTPGGPVCFLMEQVNVAGRPVLLERMRTLSTLPGVEVLAGWRGSRLRVHRVRYGLQ